MINPLNGPSAWRERFERYRIASQLYKDDGEIQVSTLIYCMGRQAGNIYKTFQFDPQVEAAEEGAEERPDPRNDYHVAINKFDTYFVPRKNKVHERTKFHQKNQQAGRIEVVIRSLHDLAEHCGFKDMENECIRSRLLIGMRDSEISQKLQMEQDELTFERDCEIARHWEMVKIQNTQSASSVHQVSKKTKPKSNKTEHQTAAKFSTQTSRNLESVAMYTDPAEIMLVLLWERCA